MLSEICLSVAFLSSLLTKSGSGGGSAGNVPTFPPRFPQHIFPYPGKVSPILETSCLLNTFSSRNKPHHRLEMSIILIII